MAILWQKRSDGVLYEVRTAGQTRRLYTDGVFHSEFNPRRRITGSLWDLLMLPAFFYPAGAIKRVLVLGVGGGAVIQKLLHYAGPQEIVGVDINPVHLYLARRYFGIKQCNVRLCNDDAVRWLAAYRGPKFDMIIDDLFDGTDGEPARAVDANTAWFNSVLQHLTPSGVFVANFPTRDEMRKSAYFSNGRVALRFEAAFALSTARLENAVGVFLRRPARSRVLRTRLRAMRGFSSSLKAPVYRIRQLQSCA